MADFNAQNVSKVAKGAAADPDASFSVEGTDGGTFAIASSKKELKQLMKSDADVVYDERKGKLSSTTTAPRKDGVPRRSGAWSPSSKASPNSQQSTSMV